MNASPPVAPKTSIAAWWSLGAWKSFARSQPGLLLFVVAAFLIGLGYSLFTNEVWEDSLITLRHSENLLQGKGLVYNPGERVHGFTSPINVLLLTLCHFVTGQTSLAATFWVYRIFTIVAFAWGGALVLRALQLAAPRWTPAIWFFSVAYLFDVRSVAFSTNGMETGFMLLFVGWAIYLMITGPGERWLLRGLCWAGLMWTRPDGCIYIAAFAAAELLFLCPGRRRVALISLAQSAAAGALLYSPWFLWAWWYYGSPIPHTVTAKSNVEMGNVSLALAVIDTLPGSLATVAARVLRPIHFTNTWLPSVGWSRAVALLTSGVGLFALLYWLFPVNDRLGRVASFCFTFLCLYFCFLSLYPWYFPPVALLALLTVARGATVFVTASTNVLGIRSGPSRSAIAMAVLSILALGQVALFGLGSRAQQVRQAEIETGHRAAIGTWLKEHGRPEDTVYLEPLGYIGYFSGMKMMDYPGLVSPRVVQARRDNPTGDPSSAKNRVALITQLNPDWVVLRFNEFEALRASPTFDAFTAAYHLEHVFNVIDNLNRYEFLPGRPALQFDSGFAVFHRVASPTLPSERLPPGN